MPLYDWECKHCETTVTLMRPFSRYKDGPADAELGEAAHCPATKDHKHGWRRDWSKGVPKFVRGPNYGDGSKGHW